MRKTWAPVGHTPIFRHSYSRERISAISAVTVSPSRQRLGLYFRFHSSNITGVEIIGFLREAEVRIAQGETAGKICRGAGISEQTYYKWRREYGGLKIDQAKRLKELERENERLKKAVSELTLDKQILKEALSGKY